MQTRSDGTPPTYTGYKLRVGRDGILWRLTLFDRYGRAHQVSEEPGTLGTLFKLAADQLIHLESA